MVEPSSHTGQPPIEWVHDPTLPLPWKVREESPGLLYFYNPLTNVFQYERPHVLQYHHQFFQEEIPYPWLPRYDWPQNPKPLSSSLPHRVTIPINYPQLQSFIREQGQDRISELPDVLISHILCFLPTISSVRTTLLSKRWNKMWTYVRYLDLDIVREMFHCRSRFESFVQFVFLRLSFTDIGKFRLRYVTSLDSDSSHLDDWVSAAVWRKVVELDLKILMAPGESPCYLPQSIFWCKTLKVLKLWMDSEIEIPQLPESAACFPSLKIFHLTVINPSDTLGILLSYFPVLEDLSIHGHVIYTYNVNYNIDVKVSAPELKTLRLTMERAKRDSEYEDDIETPNQNKFTVDAPKLENLEVVQIPLSDYILEYPNSVVNASIAFKSLAEEEWPSFSDSAYQLLAGISNVKCLSLANQPFEASNLPVFGNLNQLKLVLQNYNSWEFLKVLLHRTPNLLDLDLVLEDGTEGEKDDTELQLTPPESVPECLSSNLKTISIRGFKGLQVQRQVAKYVLLNGCHLNKMTIYTCMVEKEACNDLLAFPRAMTCQVEFVCLDN